MNNTPTNTGLRALHSPPSGPAVVELGPRGGQCGLSPPGPSRAHSWALPQDVPVAEGRLPHSGGRAPAGHGGEVGCWGRSEQPLKEGLGGDRASPPPGRPPRSRAQHLCSSSSSPPGGLGVRGLERGALGDRGFFCSSKRPSASSGSQHSHW